MRHQRSGPRAEYRQQQSQRINDSASLAERFPNLQTLAANLAFFDPEGLINRGEMKYTANLAGGKSMFYFSCPNDECVGGDFDLSLVLANVVAAQRTSAAGEMICQGWRNKATIDNVPCHHILRYQLNVEYGAAPDAVGLT
jgi:hypothetical protein